MRIICPNCDAQYEVPASVIPAEGRDVECSNCGKTWFQHHPDHMPAEDVPEAQDAPKTETRASQHEPQTAAMADMQAETPPAPPADTGASPARRELDPDVADILREEAAREQARRAAEALEVQTDLNLESPSKPSAPGPAPAPAQQPVPSQPVPPPAAAISPRPVRPARPPAPQPEPEPPAYDANALREPTSRRELLPDIEEINSTLRSTGDRDMAGDDPSPDAPIKGREKRGFRRGFISSVALMSIAALLYVFAPQIVEAVPAAEPILAQYTASVDDARIWLNGQVTELTKWLETQAEASQK